MPLRATGDSAAGDAVRWGFTRTECGPEARDGKLLNRQAADPAVSDRLRSGVLTDEDITMLLAQDNAEILARSKARRPPGAA